VEEGREGQVCVCVCVCERACVRPSGGRAADQGAGACVCVCACARACARAFLRTSGWRAADRGAGACVCVCVRARVRSCVRQGGGLQTEVPEQTTPHLVLSWTLLSVKTPPAASTTATPKPPLRATTLRWN
jgi:hypothetical protein